MVRSPDELFESTVFCCVTVFCRDRTAVDDAAAFVALGRLILASPPCLDRDVTTDIAMIPSGSPIPARRFHPPWEFFKSSLQLERIEPGLPALLSTAVEWTP